MSTPARHSRSVSKPRRHVAEIGWNVATTRRYFSNPYGFFETLKWIRNNLIGPSSRHAELTESIPQKASLNEIRSELRIGFLGDVMPLRKSTLSISAEVIDFFSDVDFLVANLEGTITTGNPGKVFLAQAHTDGILSFLETLLPAYRIIVSCSNNHSGDYGWDQFCHSYRALGDRGFIIIGRRDEPSVVIDGKVNIASCSAWSNQRCRYISTFDDVNDYLDPSVEFNILYPCWGYEMQLYPTPSQLALTEELLRKWDMIVGFHSHCPQPVAAYGAAPGDRRLVAYSLGDFSFGLNVKKYLHGIILKSTIGPNPNGKWCVGETEWSFTSLHFTEDRVATLRGARTSPLVDCAVDEREPAAGFD